MHSWLRRLLKERLKGCKWLSKLRAHLSKAGCLGIPDKDLSKKHNSRVLEELTKSLFV